MNLIPYNISKSVCRIYFLFGLWLFFGSLSWSGFFLRLLVLSLLGLDELHELFRRLSLLNLGLSRSGWNNLVGPFDCPHSLAVAHDGLVIELKAVFALEHLDLINVLHVLHTQLGKESVLFRVRLDRFRYVLASALLLLEILQLLIEVSWHRSTRKGVKINIRDNPRLNAGSPPNIVPDISCTADAK